MTHIRKYRHYLAAPLLMLYLFIATPVQWWHHHTPGPGNYVVKKGQTALIAATGAASTDDCKICSHKYSTYYDPVFVSERLILSVYTPLLACYLQPITGSYFESASNKGPPALLTQTA